MYKQQRVLCNCLFQENPKNGRTLQWVAVLPQLNPELWLLSVLSRAYPHWVCMGSPVSSHLSKHARCVLATLKWPSVSMVPQDWYALQPGFILTPIPVFLVDRLWILHNPDCNCILLQTTNSIMVLGLFVGCMCRMCLANNPTIWGYVHIAQPKHNKHFSIHIKGLLYIHACTNSTRINKWHFNGQPLNRKCSFCDENDDCFSSAVPSCSESHSQWVEGKRQQTAMTSTVLHALLCVIPVTGGKCSEEVLKGHVLHYEPHWTWDSDEQDPIISGKNPHHFRVLLPFGLKQWTEWYNVGGTCQRMNYWRIQIHGLD